LDLGGFQILVKSSSWTAKEEEYLEINASSFQLDFSRLREEEKIGSRRKENCFFL
jgi:hypothetical protein